jgi:hypothetical protein
MSGECVDVTSMASPMNLTPWLQEVEPTLRIGVGKNGLTAQVLGL